MRQFSRLLLSGLVALSLTFAATAAHASWSVSIQNVMDLVYCLVGAGDCTGLQPGADLVDIASDNAEVAAAAAAAVDITSDNAEVIAAAMPACDFEGGEVWDGSTCATPESSDPAPNCFLMGLCGQDGAASYGVPGPYSQMSSSDAMVEGWLCAEEYWIGSASSWQMEVILVIQEHIPDVCM